MPKDFNLYRCPDGDDEITPSDDDGNQTKPPIKNPT